MPFIIAPCVSKLRSDSEYTRVGRSEFKSAAISFSECAKGSAGYSTVGS